MSQHYIDGKNDNQTVVVGYDRPLDNFFATVYEDGDVVEWIPGERTVPALCAKLAPFATIARGLKQTLIAEQVDRENHPMMKVVDHRKKHAG